MALTLTSLAMRAAIAALATTCASMLAALALERGEVTLSGVASLSLMRYLSTGPLNLFSQLVRVGNDRWFRRPVLILSLLLLSTTMLGQFNSTLLSDLEDRPLPGYSTTK